MYTCLYVRTYKYTYIHVCMHMPVRFWFCQPSDRLEKSLEEYPACHAGTYPQKLWQEVGKQHCFQWQHHTVIKDNIYGLLCIQQWRMCPKMMIPTPKKQSQLPWITNVTPSRKVSLYSLYRHTVTTEFAYMYLCWLSSSSSFLLQWKMH